MPPPSRTCWLMLVMMTMVMVVVDSTNTVYSDRRKSDAEISSYSFDRPRRNRNQEQQRHNKDLNSKHNGHHSQHRMPRFVARIQNISVNVGREAVLECKVSHLGKYRVGWLKARDQTILTLHERVITNNKRISIGREELEDRREGIWRLKIQHVTEPDRGCYMCQINTEEMMKEIGCIDVKIPPNIDDDLTSSDVTVKEGEDATLMCKANGHPKPRIKWLREDGKEFPVYDVRHNHTRRSMVLKHEGSDLAIRKVQRQQMGAYLCIASNDVPPAVSKRIILNVNFAPEVTIPSQLYGVRVGDDITISCNVQAYPSSINYWMKDNGGMLLTGDKYNLSEVRRNDYETVMSLTIMNWQKSDETHFSCISTNSLGKADGRIQTYTHSAAAAPHDDDEDNEDDEEDLPDYAGGHNSLGWPLDAAGAGIAGYENGRQKSGYTVDGRNYKGKHHRDSYYPDYPGPSQRDSKTKRKPKGHRRKKNFSSTPTTLDYIGPRTSQASPCSSSGRLLVSMLLLLPLQQLLTGSRSLF